MLHVDIEGVEWIVLVALAVRAWTAMDIEDGVNVAAAAGSLREPIDESSCAWLCSL